VAIAGLLLVHIPPEIELLNITAEPLHKLPGPDIADGNKFIVKTLYTEQPVAKAYLIVSDPPETPDTIPVLPTMAMEGTLLLHVPPVAVSDNNVVVPTQAPMLPVIVAGIAFTDIVFTA
jgi:hypothetical protein